MKLSISEMAKLSFVSVRTLQYYDEIGLLKPVEVSEKGYRYYNEESLSELQVILFYKELEFSLKDILKIMTAPYYDKKQALKKQKELLILKEKRLKKIIKLVDNTLKGDNNMSFKGFDASEIENAKKKYSEEAEKLYGGSKEYKESVKKQSSFTQEEKEKINMEAASIMKEFSKNMDLSPKDEKAQKLAEKWHSHINKYYYKCTKEILSCLAEMYVKDERFKENIDKNGAGTAKFMSEVIKIYCSK